MRRLLISLLLSLMAATAFAESRALLIGIGKYDRRLTGWGETHGDSDVELLGDALRKAGFSDIATLVNGQATKKAVVSAFRTLASRCGEGDRVYVHFSGHGQLVKDCNGDEGSPKPYEESVVPYDAGRDSRKCGGGYDGRNHLLDDEIATLLADIKKAVGKNGEVFFAVDACYSRGIEKDEMVDFDPELASYIRGTDIPFAPPPGSTYLASLPRPEPYPAGGRLYVASGCGAAERNIEYRAADGRLYGSLSFYIYTLLRKDSDFSRWKREFDSEGYRREGIFQTFQHPSVILYP